MFLPFDLDSFEFFSRDNNSRFSRVKQEGDFRAQNRMVLNNSSLGELQDARWLIEGWYNNDNLRTGTFDGTWAPPGWKGDDQQKQLHDTVYARACRTCHISYEPAPGQEDAGLRFGTYQQFLDKWAPINFLTCGPVNRKDRNSGRVINNAPFGTMPNAEQTLQRFWTNEARAQLFAQLPNDSISFRDCPPFNLED